MEKNVISPLLYSILSSTPGLYGNEALYCRVLMGMKPVVIKQSESATTLRLKIYRSLTIKDYVQVHLQLQHFIVGDVLKNCYNF